MMKKVSSIKLAVLVSVCLSISGAVNASQWWDENYSSRREIQFTTGSALGQNYSFVASLDLDTLVGEGKVRADYEDVRVVYWDGNTATEIDRHIRDGAAGQDIWYALQTNKDAAATYSGEYYIYYGNQNATNALKNYDNVYRFYDGFEGTSVDTNKWTANISQFNVSNGALVIPEHYNQPGALITTDTFARDSVREYAFQISDTYAHGQLYMFPFENRIVHDYDFYPHNIREGIPQFPWDHSTTSYDVYQAEMLGSDYIFRAGTDYASLEDKATTTWGQTGPVDFRIDTQWTKQQLFMDYVLIRDTVANGPSLMLGFEEIAGGETVPEPTTISLILMGLVGLRKKLGFSKK